MKRIFLLSFVFLFSLVLSGCNLEALPESSNNSEVSNQQNEQIEQINETGGYVETEVQEIDNYVETESQDMIQTDFLQEGQVCEPGASQCAPGLKCGYPCGIQGCEHVCQPEDELPKP